MNKTEHFQQGRNYRSSQSRASSDKITSNEEDVMRSLEFLKHVLESQYVRGDRVGIKNLFLHISKAPPELQKCCGKDIKEFKKMLSKFPETFVVKNNYVCLNIFKDGKFENITFYSLSKARKSKLDSLYFFRYFY